MKSMYAQLNAKIEDLTSQAHQISISFENEMKELETDIYTNKNQVNTLSKKFEDLTNELNVAESFEKISTNAAYILKHFDYCNQIGICPAMATTSSFATTSTLATTSTMATTSSTTSKMEIETSTSLTTLSRTTLSGIITFETTELDSTTFESTTSDRISRLNITVPSILNLERHNGEILGFL